MRMWAVDALGKFSKVRSSNDVGPVASTRGIHVASVRRNVAAVTEDRDYC
jgi:hypothetical protein